MPRISFLVNKAGRIIVTLTYDPLLLANVNQYQHINGCLQKDIGGQITTSILRCLPPKHASGELPHDQ